MSETLKKCSQCQKEKSLLNFYTNKKKKDGFQIYCKSCSLEYKKKWRVSQKKRRQGRTGKEERERKKKEIEKKLQWEKSNPLEASRLKRQNIYLEKLDQHIRAKIRYRLNKHPYSFIKELGCTGDEYRRFLEKQFKEGWDWGNYGTAWNIDHIVPPLYDNPTKEKMIKRFHFKNTRAVSIRENISKGQRLPGQKVV